MADGNPTITVATHNAFWLQGAPYAGKNPAKPTPEVFHGLVRLYQKMDPDLLCLQEIHTPQVAGQLADALNRRIYHTPGCRETVYGGAVLWKPQATVTVVDHRDRPDLTCFRMWQHVHWQQPGGSSLRLLNVHLPSTRATQGRPVTSIQQGELAQQLDSRFDPHIVLGDFNSQPDSPTAKMLRQAGYLDAAEVAGCEHLTTAGNRRVDQVWIQPALQPRLVGYDVIALHQPELRPACPDKTQLSDHYPIHIRITQAASTPRNSPRRLRRST